RLPRTLSLDAALAAKKARHRLRLGDARGAGLAQSQLCTQRVRARPLGSVRDTRLALHAARTRAREDSHARTAIGAAARRTRSHAARTQRAFRCEWRHGSLHQAALPLGTRAAPAHPRTR